MNKLFISMLLIFTIFISGCANHRVLPKHGHKHKRVYNQKTHIYIQPNRTNFWNDRVYTYGHSPKSLGTQIVIDSFFRSI